MLGSLTEYSNQGKVRNDVLSYNSRNELKQTVKKIMMTDTQDDGIKLISGTKSKGVHSGVTWIGGISLYQEYER